MESTTLTLTEKLLSSKKPTEILTLEREIDFPAIVRSSEKSVALLRKERFTDLHNYATAVTVNYLAYCFPNQQGIAAQFSADLIESRPTWKAADFVNLFKFIRTRQDLPELKVFGNQITPQKLMEMVVVYEDYRAQEMEKFRNEEKGKRAEENRTLNPLAERVAQKIREKGYKPTGDEKMGKEMERTRAENKDRRTPKESGNFFENNDKPFG